MDGSRSSTIIDPLEWDVLAQFVSENRCPMIPGIQKGNLYESQMQSHCLGLYEAWLEPDKAKHQRAKNFKHQLHNFSTSWQTPKRICAAFIFPNQQKTKKSW